MMLVDDATWATLALTNRLVDVGEPPLKAAEFWALVEVVGDPSCLSGRSTSEIAEALGNNNAAPTRVAALLDVGLVLAARLQALEERGMWVTTAFDGSYPRTLRDRLGAAAPPLLYGAGDIELLTRPAVAVVGANLDDPRAVTFAQAAGEALAASGQAVVSGEVGSPAAGAARKAGGATVAIVAGSLESELSVAQTRRSLIDGLLCVATPYPPDARPDEQRGRARMKIVSALGCATLVVSVTDSSQGLGAGAAEALRRDLGPVLVWRGDGEGDGNAELEVLGATAIGTVDEVLAAVR